MWQTPKETLWVVGIGGRGLICLNFGIKIALFALIMECESRQDSYRLQKNRVFRAQSLLPTPPIAVQPSGTAAQNMSTFLWGKMCSGHSSRGEIYVMINEEHY